MQESERINNYYHDSAVLVQKNIRAFLSRVEFIREINAIAQVIEEKKEKIANIDPRFWDDAQSDSILRAEDEED